MHIEKNIPAPERARGSKYPWPDMEVGDSVFFAGDSPADVMRYIDAAKNYARNRGWKMVRRFRVADGGVRIWRVQ